LGLLVIEFRFPGRNEFPDATSGIRANLGLLLLIGLPLMVLVSGALMAMSGIGVRSYMSVFARQSLVKKVAVSVASLALAAFFVLLAATLR
jgi:hypothetical protein